MSTHGFLSIAHNTDLIFNIRVLSVSFNSICFSVQFSSVQFSRSVVSDSLRPPLNRSTPDLPVHHQLPEFTQTHDHWVADPLSSPSPPVFPFSSCLQSFPTSGSFQMSQLSKNWSFSFNISPSDEHPERISFRMDWLDLLAVQGTLKSLLQYHSSKASILLRSAFFIVHLYILYTEEKHS